MSIPSKDSIVSFMQRNRWSVMGLITLLLVIGLMGWQWYGEHFPSWDEEVLLSDGRMITVHRAHKFNTEHTLIETSLTFDLPEMGGKQTWKEFLYPAIVDVHLGKVYVVGYALGLRHRSAYLSPRYSYVAYEFTNNEWKRLPFLDLPELVRIRENLLWCDSHGVVPLWSEKIKGWCNSLGMFGCGQSRIIDLIVRREEALRAVELNGRKDTSSE